MANVSGHQILSSDWKMGEQKKAVNGCSENPGKQKTSGRSKSGPGNRIKAEDDNQPSILICLRYL